MKRINYIYIALFSLLLYNCQENNYEFGTIVTPSNITITAEVVGKSTAKPNGDGSGKVHFTATAKNAVSYKFVYDNQETVALSGKHTYNFSNLGVNTYTVTVVVSGTAGVSSSKTIQVDVLSVYAPPSDLKAKLFGFDPAKPTATSSKTWRIKFSKAKHFGLGPVGGTEIAQWYGAGPNEKAGLGMYDDRYIFSSDGTFTHITNATNDTPTVNTDGTIFGRNPHIVNDLGATTITPNGADIENYPYSDYTAKWSLTAPSGVETINLTGLAFIGYYTGGNHTYQIFDRKNANELILRTTDAANEFDWWFILTSN
jgi:hypothetical protein